MADITLNPDIQSGRVFFINDMTKVTPRQFFKFVGEGFLPVFRGFNPEENMYYFDAMYYKVDTEDDAVTYVVGHFRGGDYVVSDDLDTPFGPPDSNDDNTDLGES